MRRELLIAIAGTIVLLALFAHGLLSTDESTPAGQILSQRIQFDTSLYFVILAFAAIAFLVWRVFSTTLRVKNTLIQALKDDVELARRECSNLARSLDDQRARSLVDIVTGIPNSARFKDDYNLLMKDLDKAGKYTITMLDLAEFGHVNKDYGHHVGDEILRTIAQEFQRGLRRTESVFKHERPGSEQVYRRYDRGDEFFFVTLGWEWDALGFLLRLRRDAPRINELIADAVSTKFPGIAVSYKFDFCAGLFEISRTMEADEAIKQVGDCLQIACQNTGGMKVFWASRRTSDDLGPLPPTVSDVERRRAMELYKQATDRLRDPLPTIQPPESAQPSRTRRKRAAT